jgi:Ni,Fe-hydrogenase III large subunit/Ni,Fe-hydrogenase III component G
MTTRELLDQLTADFPERIVPGPAYPDQLYAAIGIDDVPLFADALIDDFEARLAAVFAEDRSEEEGSFFNYYVFELPGDPCYLVLRGRVAAENAKFPSLAPKLPAVNWQEREIQDWFGVEAEGHPNPRRVALHDHWPDVHPLRKDFPLATVLPPFEGEQHTYRPTLGEGVFQIPVGPVHAGIIEPGHFNFAVAGEPILYLQLRMFYKHKGTEKLFEGMTAARGVFLAEGISGDSSFSHATAYCQAVEKAWGARVPFRAEVMRTMLLEMERTYNHVADIGAIATDVAFVIAHAHAGRIREMLVRANEELTGNRLLRGMVCIGGVRRNWSDRQVSALLETLQRVEGEFNELVKLIKSSDSTLDRLQRTGILTPEKARALGIVGVGGRASGMDLDVRRDHPYAAYANLEWRVPVYQEGDVLHRVEVRVDEVRESIAILRAAAANLPAGAYRNGVRPVAGQYAFSAVEGWRGEIVTFVRTGEDGRIERCKVKDPSLNNWPALVEAVQGNIVADFPVINKSFNLSYSGTDR